jgi:hypothetical protein
MLAEQRRPHPGQIGQERHLVGQTLGQLFLDIGGAGKGARTGALFVDADQRILHYPYVFGVERERAHGGVARGDDEGAARAGVRDAERAGERRRSAQPVGGPQRPCSHALR